MLQWDEIPASISIPLTILGFIITVLFPISAYFYSTRSSNSGRVDQLEKEELPAYHIEIVMDRQVSTQSLTPSYHSTIPPCYEG
jgi:hypothetical protein